MDRPFVVAVALALGASVASAEGWRSATAATHAGARGGKGCGERLASQVYRCQVRAEAGTTFEDCFRFTSPGLLSDKFDLTTDLLDGAPLGCTCQARGTPKRATFNALPFFTCTGDADATAFDGKVSGNGKKIAKGFAANPEGGSFVFTCSVDPACAVTP